MKKCALSNTNKRNSSFELLKIVGMLLIVISHCIGSLTDNNTHFIDNSYLINDLPATGDLQHIVLALLSYSSPLGVNIFFICSAWFLLDSSETNIRKVIRMIIDVWVVSLLFLFGGLMINDGGIDTKTIFRSLLPTINANNWYVTCYLIFLFVFPFINKIIRMGGAKEHLRICIFMGLLYIILNSYAAQFFFTSNLIQWISLYFILGYIKLYKRDFCNNLRLNIYLALFGILFNIIMVLIKNCVSLQTGYLSDELIFCNTNNVFLLITCFALFNIAQKKEFHNLIINRISSMTLFIYIVHENIIFREYFRPLYWQYLYSEYGYSCLLVWLFIMVIGLFLISYAISELYKALFSAFISKISEKVYLTLALCYNKIEKSLM